MEIAHRLQVTRASVAKMLKVLAASGLVEKAPYGAVRLTARGAEQTKEFYREFLLLQSYLRQCLQVPQPQAEQDAVRCLCQLSRETRERMTHGISSACGSSHEFHSR